MRWRQESWNEHLKRVFHEWHPRFALLPHRCDSRDCGVRVWWEPMLSRMESGYDSYRMWACSPECAGRLGK